MRWLPVVLLVLTISGCGWSPAETPAAPAREEPSEPPPQTSLQHEAIAEGDGVPEAFFGRWVQTDDPTGQIASDPVYAGSTIEMGEDGSYAFGLGGGGSMGPMRGQWRRTGGEGDELRYVVIYSGGRETAEQIMRLRRVDDEVVGIEEGGEVEGFRFYTRAAAP